MPHAFQQIHSVEHACRRDHTADMQLRAISVQSATGNTALFFSYLTTTSLDDGGACCDSADTVSPSSGSSDDMISRILSSPSSARLPACSKPNTNVMTKQLPMLSKISKSNHISIISIIYVVPVDCIRSTERMDICGIRHEAMALVISTGYYISTFFTAKILWFLCSI